MISTHRFEDDDRRSVAAVLIEEVNRLDVPHRKGWRPSEFAGKPLSLDDLKDEIRELSDAVDDFNARAARAAGDDGAFDEALRHAREELADSYACLLQAGYRLGMTFAALDAEAERKIRLRFLGADRIEVGRTSVGAECARRDPSGPAARDAAPPRGFGSALRRLFGDRT